ncbi:MAG: histidine phosphatase family protein [Bacteroidota bacterium]
MKTLYLVRHAKSSWTFDLTDHDRPLGKRGRKDIIKMGEYLQENHLSPEKIISSTASRAFYTALFLCDHWGIDESRISLTENLFHAGASEIIHTLKGASECDILAIFGHNPGFTDAANVLSNAEIENIPTCGIVGISFEINHWSEVAKGLGKQLFFYYPKGI